MKTLLCAFCFENKIESPEEGGIDVSHLAIPPLDPVELGSSDNNNNNNNSNCMSSTCKNDDSNNIPSKVNSNPSTNEYPHAPTPSTPQNRPQPAPPSPRISSISVEPDQRPTENPESRGHSPRLEQVEDALVIVPPKSASKYPYDIISVREPLAKMLAEKQRQLPIGEHDYNEVYGERGSSVLYEEIGGNSTNSSVTYDQIGAPSSNNYQASIDAYAVVSRSNRRAQDNDGYESVQPRSLIHTYAVVNRPNRRTQDNDGYESVQPRNSSDMYAVVTRPDRRISENHGYESVPPQSSPSNAMIEPNYEAIGPASES